MTLVLPAGRCRGSLSNAIASAPTTPGNANVFCLPVAGSGSAPTDVISLAAIRLHHRLHSCVVSHVCLGWLIVWVSRTALASRTMV